MIWVKNGWYTAIQGKTGPEKCAAVKAIAAPVCRPTALQTH